MSNLYGAKGGYPLSPFIIDKVFSSRTEMDTSVNTDGIGFERYVLIKYCEEVYEQEDRKILQSFVKYRETEPKGYYIDETHEYNLNDETKITYSSLSSDQKLYIDNYLKDKTTYSSLGTLGMSYDQTVWEKKIITKNIVKTTEIIDSEGNPTGETYTETFQNSSVEYISVCNLAVSYNPPEKLTDASWKGTGENAIKLNKETNQSSGDNSLTYGSSNQANSSNSFAGGHNSYTIGYCSKGLGRRVAAIGEGARADGHGNISLGGGSISEGLSSNNHLEIKPLLDSMRLDGEVEVEKKNNTSGEIEKIKIQAKPYNPANLWKGWNEGTTLYSWGQAATNPTEFKKTDEAQAIKALWEYGKTLPNRQGYFNIAIGQGAHTEGTNNYAIGYGAHVEGQGVYGQGNGIHAEGIRTFVASNGAHAEGWETKITGGTQGQHSEGSHTIVSANSGHAEGEETQVSSNAGHAEGQKTKVTGEAGHSEGINTEARGKASHAGGNNTIASAENQTVVGKYNDETSNALFIVGNGNGVDIIEGNEILKAARSNAFQVFDSGIATVQNTNWNDGASIINVQAFNDKTEELISTSLEEKITELGVAEIAFSPSKYGIALNKIGWYSPDSLTKIDGPNQWYPVVQLSLYDLFSMMPLGTMLSWNIRTTFGQDEINAIPQKFFHPTSRSDVNNKKHPNFWEEVTNKPTNWPDNLLEKPEWFTNPHIIYIDSINKYDKDGKTSKEYKTWTFPVYNNNNQNGFIEYGTQLIIHKSTDTRAIAEYHQSSGGLTELTLKKWEGMFTAVQVNGQHEPAWSGWYLSFATTIPTISSGASTDSNQKGGYVVCTTTA